MLILTLFVYCFYIIAVFGYSSDILGKEKIAPISFAILMIVNSFIVFTPIFTTEFRFQFFLMLAYIIVLTIEIKILFKRSLAKSLFGVFSFAINFFAIRSCIIVIMSFVTNQPIVELLTSLENRILITCLNLAIPIPYILLTRKILKGNILGIALSDMGTTLLSTTFLGSVFIYQMVVSLSLLKTGENLDRNLLYHLVTALFSICVFTLVMAINYIYSNLKIVADNYTFKIKEIRLQDQLIKEIEYQSLKDSMTGLYLRDVAVRKVEKYIDEKVAHFIIFIDIDGLKNVNDNFGHVEGDWYITTVSKKIKTALDRYTIARLGGDEFLVVGKTTENIDITNVIKNLESDISNMAKNYHKRYQTSISYGIQKVDTNNSQSSKELIDMADKKMYNFKKEHKRHRKF